MGTMIMTPDSILSSNNGTPHGAVKSLQSESTLDNAPENLIECIRPEKLGEVLKGFEDTKDLKEAVHEVEVVIASESANVIETKGTPEAVKDEDMTPVPKTDSPTPKPEHLLGEGVELMNVPPLPKKPFKPSDEMKAHLADVKSRAKLSGDVKDGKEKMSLDGGPQFQAAAVCLKGTSELRSSNEDRYTLLQGVATGVSMLAVYDGHGGDDTSSFLKKTLPGEVAKQIMMVGSCDTESLAGVLSKAIKFCEDKFCKDNLPQEPDSDEEEEEFPEGGYTSHGSCLLVALYNEESHTLLVANVGDSRSVLGLPDATKAFGLSRDQTAANPLELARVKAAGATVDEFGYIQGEMAPSRAIGDVQFKGGDPDMPPKIILAEPEISCYRQVPSGSVVLLASDGLWDAVSSDEAVAMAQSFLKESTALETCAKIGNEATRVRGSEDDTTVVLLHVTY